MILLDILEEHLEEADFLFQQWTNALTDRAYDLDGFAELEERLLAHLDGLVLGGKEAWTLLEPKLAGGEVGEVFAAAFVAVASGEPARIGLVQKTFAEAEGPVLDGIRHALRHTPSPEIEKIVRPSLHSEKGAVRAAAIDLIGFRRLPLESRLLQAGLQEKDPLVVAAAANAAGRLRLADLKNEIEGALESDAASARLEAMRAGLLLKSERALSRCRKAVQERAEEGGEAILLLGLLGHPEDGLLLVNALGEAALARNAVMSLGLLGRAAGMEALIQCTADPKLARWAGEAVRTVTGVDLEKENLVAPKAEAKAEEEDELEDDPDEGLPVPDPAKVEAWWRKNASRFDKKARYRKGQPYSPQKLIELLHTGTLPERHHAALEFALIDSKRSPLETRAFAARQRKEMADLKSS
ncbi:MAG: TIGR02270 family protein [Candidatus Manganitrophus sp.]|nr:TIGR02270 family protein [Candidatus Manganitrophus sp.]MDC4227015.1 TIGR02270 family protein [Candidatus Manganitrophus sp.]WDT71896.1 MAG: TIGR02270 family protein [Candidatus Manganitrophus sp.]WDT80711.1 MAG: TIGR02270 family protein [Candidatus Manganitrophus sp.]